MNFIDENLLEKSTLAWFESLGYEVQESEFASPENSFSQRASYKQTILAEKLRAALNRLNPNLPDIAIEEAFNKVTRPESPSLIVNNRQFHKYLTHGVNVSYQTKDREVGDFAKIIDFDDITKNDFLVVNQFTVQGANNIRRPDVVVFINGLPIAVIELKNPVDENANVNAAFNQLLTYKEQIEDLFLTNEILVISDGIVARVGSLTSDLERFMPWRTINGKDPLPKGTLELEALIRGVFDRKMLLEYLQYFILFEESEGKTIKKIAGYHQFHAVKDAVEKTVEATHKGGDGRCGVVWHTQGSGKSISMCCYAGMLMKHPKMQNPTILIVTDRNDLDGQLFTQFALAKDLLGEVPVQIEDTNDLRDKLSSRASGGIIFTTVQKFTLKEEEKDFPVLCDRSNIVVISDEAHRSQYGHNAKLNKKTGQYQYGYSKYLRDALPNAGFIGFTGTPIDLRDKSTQAVFGDYISIYDIEQAQKDKATVPIYYESRLAQIGLVNEGLAEIDEEVDEITEDEEFAEGEKIKSKWAEIEAIVGAAPRIKKVVEDLVSHFETRLQLAPNGKAMIVCMSREICVHMYDAIVAIRPDWHDADPKKGKIKIIMTGNASDEPLLRPHVYTKKVKQDLEVRYKNENDALKIVIVRDMWLTGFDVPCMNTMYIDKPMQGHNLMQAIARVNRVFKGKEGGLVVDYLGITNSLRKAVKTYTDSNGKGEPSVDISKAYHKLLDNIEKCRGMFDGFDYSNYKTSPLSVLAGAADHILGLPEGKKRYADIVLAITHAVGICGTMLEVRALMEEIAFFQAIKAVIYKKGQSEKEGRTDSEINDALRRIVSNAITSDKVIDIFQVAGLEKPDISILSNEFLEDIKHLKQKNLAFELLQRLINDQIKSRSATNIILFKKFSEKLKNAVLKYQNRGIETAQVIEELIQLARELNAAQARGEQLKLNNDELAFYDALESNETAVRELGDEILKKIAQELTEKLRKSTKVDWFKRETVRAELRLMVKRILRFYKYPPDAQDEAVNLVLEQAEKLSESWIAKQ